MRVPSFLVLLVLAGSVHANDSINVGHKTDSDEAKPMAWRFSLLEKARSVFEKRAAEQAPGATMSFRLPKVDAAQGGNQVEIVGADHRLPLPMASNTTFSLTRGTLAEDDGAMVVVNRNFPKGEFNHPLVQVRSPGLPDGVQRMGDLRLACAAPKGAYDSVTIEDGGRRLVQSAKDKHPAKLGDKAWSDNARISYTLDGHLVQ